MEQSSANNILERDYESILGTYARAPIEFVKGHGATLIDSDEKSYLDFGSGIAVSALGHDHPKIIDALQEAIKKPLHISNLYPSLDQIELAEGLLEKLPFDKVFFCNSGTEANEAVLKFARKYWFSKGRADKVKVISFTNSFHGRTYGALSVTGQPKLQEGFGPMVPGSVVLPYNDAGALVEALSDDQVAAVILEPLQAEGGLNAPSKEFVRVLNEKRKAGQFLILGDEVQCSLGRLGEPLGGDVYGLEYDMITIAKPLGGGLPLGAVLLKTEQAVAIKPGDHGTTFGGNPLSCSLGKVVIDHVLDDEFLKEVKAKSAILNSGLESLVEAFESCLEVKGTGLLMGVKVSCEIPQVIDLCRAQGLIVLRAGADVIRLAPPLIVSNEEILKALEILKETLTELEVK